MEENQAIGVMKGIVTGYEFLYANNIMHRDLKPSNIFLHNGQVKIGMQLKLRRDYKVNGINMEIIFGFYAV